VVIDVQEIGRKEKRDREPARCGERFSTSVPDAPG
jgi:hypothetical protein